MSVTRKGGYFLLSNDLTLEDELSDLDIPFPEPAPLHKRNIQGRESVPTTTKATRHGQYSGLARRPIKLVEDGHHPYRTHTYIQMDVVPGVDVRQFDGVRWNSSGTDRRRSTDEEETVKCIISSVLFLAIVVTVVVVALVKNPEM